MKTVIPRPLHFVFLSYQKELASFYHTSLDQAFRSHPRIPLVLPALNLMLFKLLSKFLHYGRVILISSNMFKFTFLTDFLVLAICGSSSLVSSGFCGAFPNFTLDNSSTGSSGCGRPFLEILSLFGSAFCSST